MDPNLGQIHLSQRLQDVYLIRDHSIWYDSEEKGKDEEDKEGKRQKDHFDLDGEAGLYWPTNHITPRRAVFDFICKSHAH